MAKIVKFPLKLADGTNARSLEELREQGDVASVLGHYRQGTLARWLKAFGQNELAEQVVEHRNAQVDSSRANLQELFSLLGISLDEAAFNEYCEKQLSDKFIFSDTVDGDFKTYGQGVSIKDKLVEFLPQKEFLDDWEVTETPLDGDEILVEFVCEKLKVSVNFQTNREDGYKKIAEQLQKQVLVFCPDSNCSQNAESYKIGDRGPGGGIVYHIEKNLAYEVSDDLGEYNWFEAKAKADSYCGGGFNDWNLPNRNELNLIYENLRKKEIIHDDNQYWSVTIYSGVIWSQKFSNGVIEGVDFRRKDKFSVRAVRYFRIDEKPVSDEAKNENGFGTFGAIKRLFG